MTSSISKMSTAEKSPKRLLMKEQPIRDLLCGKQDLNLHEVSPH